MLLMMSLSEHPELAVPGINGWTFLWWDRVVLKSSPSQRRRSIFFLSNGNTLTLCCNDPLTSDVKWKFVTFTHAVRMKVLSEGCVVLIQMFGLNVETRTRREMWTFQSPCSVLIKCCLVLFWSLFGTGNAFKHLFPKCIYLFHFCNDFVWSCFASVHFVIVESKGGDNLYFCAIFKWALPVICSLQYTLGLDPWLKA